jgi:hypothetical protein
MDSDLIGPSIVNEIDRLLGSLRVKRIRLGENTGINGRHMITDVFVLCESDKGADYNISFKLLSICADISQHISTIEMIPEITVQFTDTALAMSVEEREQLLDRFLSTVGRRIREAKKEQEIQSIQYLGNTFELNKKTVFKVISDDGEGHLGIEILGSPDTGELKLSAHGLLDGLYSGFIRELENQK